MKIAARGLLVGLATIAAFLTRPLDGRSSRQDALEYARTLAFCTLVGSQLIYVFQCRSERRDLLS